MLCNPIDPVCGRRVDPNLAWEHGLVTQHRDRTCYFCSPACRQEFAWNRHAYTMADDLICGRPVDPEEAELAGLYNDFDGVRYHFCSRACQQRFGQDPRFYRDARQREEKHLGPQAERPPA